MPKNKVLVHVYTFSFASNLKITKT